MATTNYCLINPNGGAIEVRISVNNGIRSASLFVLWELQNGSWKQKESFKLITGSDGVEEHILLEKPAEIENDSLAWNIQACAQIDGANQGIFEVGIYQDGKRIWKKDANRTVPYCKDGKHLLFGNDVIFKHTVESNSNTPLWKAIER